MDTRTGKLYPSMAALLMDGVPERDAAEVRGSKRALGRLRMAARNEGKRRAARRAQQEASRKGNRRSR